MYELPGLAQNADGVFVSTLTKSRQVFRVNRGAEIEPFATFPTSPDAGQPGSNILAGGCETLWTVLEKDRLVGADTRSQDAGFAIERDIGGSQSIHWWTAVADAQYVYIGAANQTARLVAIDPATGRKGNVDPEPTIPDNPVPAWRLAVDDDGLYWGDHGLNHPQLDEGRAGTIYMMKKR